MHWSDHRRSRQYYTSAVAADWALRWTWWTTSNWDWTLEEWLNSTCTYVHVVLNEKSRLPDIHEVRNALESRDNRDGGSLEFSRQLLLTGDRHELYTVKGSGIYQSKSSLSTDCRHRELRRYWYSTIGIGMRLCMRRIQMLQWLLFMASERVIGKGFFFRLFNACIGYFRIVCIEKLSFLQKCLSSTTSIIRRSSSSRLGFLDMVLRTSQMNWKYSHSMCRALLDYSVVTLLRRYSHFWEHRVLPCQFECIRNEREITSSVFAMKYQPPWLCCCLW